MSMLDICRICMDSNFKLMDIFATTGMEEEESSLADILNECTNCQVQRDALPQHICSTCALDARNAFHFKRKCEQSYSQLLQQLKCNKEEEEEKWQPQVSIEDSDGEELTNYEQESEHDTKDCLVNESKSRNSQNNKSTGDPRRYHQHHTCKECTLSHDSRAELNAQIRQVGHNKPMLCPECGLRCKNSHTLTIHQRRHSGEKPYKCKFCSKGFPRLDDVRVHEKYHTGEKSHFCKICEKGFQRKYNLTIHMRIHTGEKPYKCSHCPQAFTQSNDLKSHIRRHTGERFRCESCQASFLQLHKLRLHKLAKHGIEEKAPIYRLTKFRSVEEQQHQIKHNLEQELYKLDTEMPMERIEPGKPKLNNHLGTL